MKTPRTPTLSDGTGGDLRTVLAYARSAQRALEQEGDEDAALRFVFRRSAGKPFGFTYKSIGL